MKSKSFSFSNDEAGRFAKHRLLDFIRYEKLSNVEHLVQKVYAIDNGVYQNNQHNETY